MAEKEERAHKKRTESSSSAPVPGSGSRSRRRAQRPFRQLFMPFFPHSCKIQGYKMKLYNYAYEKRMQLTR
jgi:hypothetical protein